MQKKKHLLCLAILIPVFMIVITALSILCMTKNIAPQQRFLFAVSPQNNPYYCVEEMRALFSLASQFPELPANARLVHAPCPPMKFYVYDFNTKTSKEVSLEEAKNLPLSKQAISNDGFTIKAYCNTGRAFPDYHNNFNEYFGSFCLNKRGYTRRFNPRPENNFSQTSYVTFITWLQGNN